MNRAITLNNGIVYSIRHIMSFYKYQNPATKDLFIILSLSNGDKDSIKYESATDRTGEFRLLMDCFEFGDWKNDSTSWSKVKI